jgi:hypothetical protein
LPSHSHNKTAQSKESHLVSEETHNSSPANVEAIIRDASAKIKFKIKYCLVIIIFIYKICYFIKILLQYFSEMNAWTDPKSTAEGTGLSDRPDFDTPFNSQ